MPTRSLGIRCGSQTPSELVSRDLRYVRSKLDIVGNYVITQASSLYHICKENRLNSSYTVCHEKC